MNLQVRFSPHPDVPLRGLFPFWDISFDKSLASLRFNDVFNRLKQLLLFVLLGALFVRGNASGLHHHVELCQEIAQELCCDHDDASFHTHCETPPMPQHGHCPHECREDVSQTMGSVGILGDVMTKPILRVIAFVVLPSAFELEKRTLEKFVIKDTGPPPQVHLIRDTVRLL